MAVKIADGYIDVILDTSTIDAQLAQIEARIQNIQNMANNALNTANSALSTANAANSAASSAMANANAAAAAAGSARGGGGGGGASVGGGGFTVGGVNLAGFGTLPDTIRRATNPNSPSGRGFSLGEDIGGTLRLLGARGDGFFAGGAGEASTAIGDALMTGTAKGINEAKGQAASAMRNAVSDAIKAGQDEAEISSPSKRAARDIGSPIMRGIELEVMAGGQGVANAMVNSIDYAFTKTVDTFFGGTFISRNNSPTVANPGGGFAGVGDYARQFGQQIDYSFAVSQPTSFGESSRTLLSNFPTKVRDFGQGILSSVVESVLPGFVAGPISDLIGTELGTRPILTSEAALANPTSADQGGFTDSPFVGGQFVFNNDFGNVGNFTETEREVQLGILQSMRRLGVGF